MKNDDNHNQSRFYLDIKDIQSLYLGFVMIFICTGFFYNLIFLRLFGIKCELFFTLQDYLSSSIEKVYLIFIAVLVASVSSHVVRYLLREKKYLLYHRLLLGALYAFPFFILILDIVLLKKYDNPFGYYLLSLIIYIVIDYFLFRIIFKGNHESYAKFFFVTVFLLYLLILGSAIITDRNAIFKEPLNELKRYRIHFIDKVKLDQGPLVLLESNSSYYFFYNKQERRALIFQKNMIEYVENLR